MARLKNASVWLTRVALLAAIVGSVAANVACDQTDAAAKPPAAAAKAVVVVDRVRKTTLTSEARYLGQAVSRADALLNAAEPGRVRRVHVTEGDVVKQGQLLLELDDRLAQAELNAALAERRKTELVRAHQSREAERFDSLQQEQIVSSLEAERERAEALRLAAQSEESEASVRMRNVRLFRHRIEAPFDGTIVRRHVDPGDWLAAGQPALQLLASQRLEVLVRVPESVLNDIENVHQVRIVAPSKHADARIAGVVNALDPETRTALLRVDTDDRIPGLHPGSPVQVSLTFPRSGGVVVPRDALVYGVSAVRVMRVNDGQVQPVTVQVLVTTGTEALVETSELTVGDVVVVRGNERLRPGQSVTMEAPIVPGPRSSNGASPPSPTATIQ